MNESARPYGDPETWDEIPPALLTAVCSRLGALGWTVATAHETGIQVAVTEAAAYTRRADEEFWLGFAGGSWTYGTAPEDGPIRNPQELPAEPDDAESIARAVDNVLRTGNPYGTTA